MSAQLNPVIIFGAKGLGRVALDIFESNGVVVYGFLDDDASLHNSEISHVTVLGDTDDDGFLKLIGKKCDAFIAIDELKPRRHTTEDIMERRQVMPCNALHKTAVLAASAGLGHGNLMGALSQLGAEAVIGNHNIIMGGAIIEHQARLGDYVHVGSGAIIGAGATIEDNVFIGTGAVIPPGITVGKGARVGAGSVVVENVAGKATVFGNPAKSI